MPLDNQSFLFSLIVVCLTISFSLFFVAAHDPEKDGLIKWAGAMLLEAFAWFFILERGILPDWLSIAVANAMIAGAQAMKLAGIYAFRKHPCPSVFCWLPPLLTVFILLWLPYDDIARRFVSTSLIFSIQMLLIAVALYGNSEARLGRAWKLLFGSATALIPLFVMRGYHAWTNPDLFSQPNVSLPPNAIQLIVFTFIIAMSVMGPLGFILMFRERADREQRQLAATDPLTGVLNRRAFMETARKEWSLSRRKDLPLSLMMIDIDHFKQFNDRFGHAAGDTAIKQVAHALCARLRWEDSVGRYGGEEFSVLLPMTDCKEAHALAEELRMVIAGIHLVFAGESTPVTVSIGIAAKSSHSDSITNLDLLLQMADAALYQAKRHGRNQVVPFSASEEAQTTFYRQNGSFS